MSVTILPGPFEHVTKQHLLARGLALSTVRRGAHVRTVAHRPVVPVLTNVVRLTGRESAVESIFKWLAPEMHR